MNNYSVCPECGAEDTIYVKQTDPVFKIDKYFCQACGKNVNLEKITVRRW